MLRKEVSPTILITTLAIYWTLDVPHPKLMLMVYQCGDGMSTFYDTKCPCFVGYGWAALSFKCLPFDVT